MQDYIIGVDAGGTKTTAAAYSMSGVKLAEEEGGFGNTTVDFKQALSNVCKTVDSLIKRLDGTCLFICFGCAGIETGDLKPRAKEILTERYGKIITVTNDAMLALYAALQGKDGILIIAGTGSIGYLKKGKTLHRFGGWGHLINDDGSGYSVVMKAIRFITYSFDTQKPETPLKQAIFQKLGIAELRQLIDFTYHSTKGEIASLVPVIEQVADASDPQANEILEWAGERLAWLAVNLYRNNPMPAPKIAVSGSVILKTKRIRCAFEDTLNRELPDYTLIASRFEPTCGGYYLWKEQM